eukprot:Anaeramoba_ignava/a608912_68.p2 GENE.a608912_68~~a608912_68.p2  ORF type:complete len:187 (+),score=-4.74 a608912_68:1273-1833(+)
MKEKRDKYIYIKFLIIFCISLFMIIWTIVQTSKAGVGNDDDNAFLSTYHDVDENFNNIVMQNNAFEKKYNIKFTFNDQDIIGLSYKDVFLAQRVVQERKIRKDMIKIGQNNFTVLIQDKDGNPVKNKKIDILVTKSVTHDHDVKLSFNNEDTKTFNIDSIGYWNITGTVDVNGEKGSFYIKTNAKK